MVWNIGWKEGLLSFSKSCSPQMNDSELCERKRYLLWNQQNKCVVAWKVTNLPDSTFWQRRNIPTSKLWIKHAWKSRKKIRESSWCLLPDLKLLRQRLIVLLLPLLDHLILLFPPLVHHAFRGNLVPQFLTDLIRPGTQTYRTYNEYNSDSELEQIWILTRIQVSNTTWVLRFPKNSRSRPGYLEEH